MDLPYFQAGLDGHGRAEPIAIIGSACRFPGGANSPSKLWDLLSQPRDVLSPISARTDGFNQEAFYHPKGTHHGTSNVKEAYLLDEDPRLFDADFFSIKPIEAHAMDPQQRILLETVYESIESGGLSIQDLAGSQTAVYVGQMWADYDVHVQRDMDALPTYTGTGTARSILSNRISHFFDWHGPSVTLDTACSSSLVAVYNAALTLRSGDASVAIAAGANMILTPEPYIGMSNLKMVSAESRSRMWDEKVQGYARGEGVAALVLKKLSDAIRDGDHIECVIREVGVNQDGRTREGITMPSQHAQRALIEQTYAKAGLDPRKKEDRCQFFEAHGTGTAAGDPREAEAIASAFFGGTFRSQDVNDVLHVGSVKTVIGHTEGTAGIAGIMKASLAMQHGLIPPNMLFDTLNPKVAPFYHSLNIPTSGVPWPGECSDEAAKTMARRRTSVNSFGFGGTNAHVILENYSAGATPLSSHADFISPAPFVFSASSLKSLKTVVGRYVDHLILHPNTNARDLSYTLSSRRSTLRMRVAFAAGTVSALVPKLRQWLADDGGQSGGGTSSGSLASFPSPSTSNDGILGIFTGQGAQWATMGSGLIAAFPRVRAILDQLDQALQTLPPEDRPEWSMVHELQADVEASRLGHASIAQPLCTAVQIVLVQILRAAGISFKAVIGHSSGEIGAAYAAGYLSACDAIRIAYYRGLAVGSEREQSSTDRRGAMMAVTTSYEDAKDVCSIERLQDRIQIAAVNSSSSLTLSGDADAIEEAHLIFQDEGKFARLLRVDKAYHSHHMQRFSGPYLRSLMACEIAVEAGSSNTSWYSSVLPNTKMTPVSHLASQYWIDNMVQPVLFSQAIESAWARDGSFAAVIEVGPHAALKGPALQTLSELAGNNAPSPVYTGLLSRNIADVEALQTGLGEIWKTFGHGNVAFDALDNFLHDSAPRQLIKGLPTYSWDHDKVFWHESREIRARRTRVDTPHDLLGMRTTDGLQGELRWRNLLRLSEIPWVRGHTLQGQVVFPATGYLVTAMEAARSWAGSRELALLDIRDFRIHRAIALDDSSDVETDFALSVQHDGDKEAIATFQYFACIKKDAVQLELIASGSLRLTFAQAHSPHIEMAPRGGVLPNLIDVDPDLFYNFLHETGYEYSGSFQGIQSIKRKLNYGTGSLAVVEEEWGGPKPIMAPAFLDLALQTMFVAFGWPRDGSLLDVHVPVQIGSVKLDVYRWLEASKTRSAVDFVSTLDNTPGSIKGDVSIFCPTSDAPLIHMDGISVVPLSPHNDLVSREIYARTTYWSLHMNSSHCFAEQTITETEQNWASDLERVSLFYIRKLNEEFASVSHDRLALPHHEHFLIFTDHIVSRLKNGNLPFADKEWLQDTEEDIDAILNRYPEKVDGQLLRIVGENMGASMRGETDLLQHMFQGDIMDRWYVESLGFDRLMEWLGQMARHLTSIHPHMNILELGAGTGGATKSIFKHIEDRFASYTFTDISPSFFEQAARIFQSQKPLFKVLDVEKDIEQQNFEPGSYDLVVASNVLHATRQLDESLRAARKLLKPGGYLLICEITTHDVLRVRLPFSCLSGWWLGREDGRPLSATIDTIEWNTRLLRTGFSGVDAISDEASTLVLASNVILSQAVDDRVRLLREPLTSALPDSLRVKTSTVVIGGLSLPTAALVGQISRILSPHFSSIVKVGKLEDLANIDLPRGCNVINLGDLDKPALEAPTDATLRGLKSMFDHPRQILWITSGFRDINPFQSMSVGLGRVLMVEMPAGRLQFLDLSDGARANSARIICEAHLRWNMLAEIDADSDLGSLLWTHERELVYDGEALKAPRIAFDKDMNMRYMASRIGMNRIVEANGLRLAFERRDSGWVLSEYTHSILTPQPTGIAIQVAVSSAIPCFGGFYVSLGVETQRKRPVMALSTSNASCLQTPVASIEMSSTVMRNGWVCAASAIATELQAACIVDQVPFGSIIILWEPSIRLAQSCQRLCPEKQITIVLVTETKPMMDTGLGWTVIPRHSKPRHILSMLPDLNVVGAMIDCSDSSPNAIESALDRLLPLSCWRIALSDITRRKASPAKVPEQMLAEIHIAVSNMAEHWTEEMKSSGVHSKTLEAVDVSRDLDTSTSLIVDWAASSRVSASIQPVEELLTFSHNKTYILFGLTSDLGQSIAEWLAARGARHIVLTSRKPNVSNEWLRLMSTFGVNVQIIASDITLKDDVQRTVDEIRRTMPPIGGVANGAMVLMDSAFLDTSLDQVTQTLAPKVTGSLHIESALHDDKLDFFIFFSSIACLSGNRSQGIYSAANMFMTSLAARRRKQGLVASVMHIGAILGLGYMSRSHNDAMSQNLFSALWKSGVDWLSERDLHNAFGEAVLAGRPELGHAPEFSLGFRRLKIGQDTAIVMSNPRFSQILVNDEVQNSSVQVMANRAMPAKARLLEARAPAEVENIIRESVVAKMKSILQLDAGKPEAEILASTPEDLGTDSLVTVDLRNWFASELRSDVPVLKLLGGISIAELIDFIVGSLSDDMTPNLDRSLTGHEISAATGSAEPSAAHVVVASAPAEAPSVSESTSESTQISTPLSASWVSVPEPRQGEVSHKSWNMDSTVEDASILGTSPRLPPEEEMLSRPNELDSATSKLSPRRSRVVRTAALSLGQARLWFLQQYLADTTALNVSVMIYLRGQLDYAAFERAVGHVANTHEALRTSFSAQDGIPRQSVLAESGLGLETLTVHDEMEARAAFNDLKRHDYDLSAGQTMKIMLLSLAGSSSVHFLLIGYHHINMDGVSLEVLLSDIQTSYHGGALRQPIQYPDFAIAQRNALDIGDMSEEKRFWAQEMNNAPQVLPLLPFSESSSRRALHTYSFVSATTDLGVGVSEALRSVTKASRTSPFHFFLAVFGILLSRVTTSDEVCIGMAEAGRELGKYAQSVGFYVNLLPLRLQIGTDEAARTFEEVLLHARQKAQRAMAHARLPFNEILDSCGVGPAETHSPLFQAFINYRTGVSTKREYCGCQGEGQDVNASATGYDISLDIVENPGAPSSLRFDLQASLYTQRHAQILMDSFVGLVRDFASNVRADIRQPNLYGMSDDATHKSIQVGRGRELPCTWAGTLMNRIEMIASHEPNSPALVDDLGSTLSYRAMMKRVQVLVSHIEAVVQCEKALVGVCFKPSFESICAMLAVLQAGCVLVPLNPRLPVQRLASIASNAGIRLLLAHQSTADMSLELRVLLPSEVAFLDISKPGNTVSPTGLPPMKTTCTARDDDLIAVLFTSGSTGTPKGVELTHAGVRNTIAAMAESLGPTTATVLQQTAVSFDLYLAQVFLALCSGGKLVIVPEEKRLDPAAVCAIVLDEEVTLTMATPSEYTAWLSHGREALEQSKPWKLAMMVGEMYSPSIDHGLRNLGLPDLQLANGYGPTESSIYCACGVIGPDEARTGQPPSVLHALANTSIYILDCEGRPVPTSAAGEIFVGGAGVARGYLGDSARTGAQFIQDPYASTFALSQGWSRMYRTGDRGKLDETGALTVLGRIAGDTQVKIRGVRIELQEIEKVVTEAALGLVDQVIVSTRGLGSDLFLVAHGVLTASGRAASPDIEETSKQIQHLVQQSSLPSSMRPAVTILVDSFPLNLHGKVDRQAISAYPVEQHLARLQKYGAGGGSTALTPSQLNMLETWRRVLGGDRVPSGLDYTVDFFSLGGTSLQLIRIRTELERMFDKTVAVADLFQDSSLVGMAATAFGNDAHGPGSDGRAIPVVDWDQEVLLAPGLDLAENHNGGSAMIPSQPPQVVLLTGATGFVGRALVEVLLTMSSVRTIHCLAVRDASKLGALQSHPRLKIHVGDLGHPTLSLSREEQMHLAQTVDLIIHNGADVSFLKSYQSLRAPNVSSTKFLVALAAPRLVPVHYISTTSVGRLLLQEKANRSLSDRRFSAVSLRDTAPGPDWTDGYTASKWASEVILERSTSQLHVPATVHRLSSVTADDLHRDTAAGAHAEGVNRPKTTDLVASVVDMSLRLRAVPDAARAGWRGVLDFVSVSRVARGVVESAFLQLEAKASPTVRFEFQNGEQLVPVGEFAQYVALRLGVATKEVEVVEVGEWLQRARGAGMDELVVAAFLHETQGSSGGGLVFQEVIR